jgi:ribonuclease III
METIEEYAMDLLKADDENVLALALTPKSSGARNNQRLEFLGNAVLNMRLAEALYNQEPDLPSATMTLMCNYLRSDPVLVMVGKEGGLAMMLARHNSDERVKVTDKMVSIAFQAIIGALYEKAGYEAASGFIDRFLLLDDMVAGSTSGKGPVTDLKERVDRDRDLIVTHSTSERNEAGETIFRHSTTVNGKTLTGEGKTKKRAEAMAAVKALAVIRSLEQQ